jgi:hypothetical protein
MLLTGASAGLIGGAPRPLDPKLSAVAPESCLWYGAYSGQQAADPESENETEQLFAEPQVQRFFAEVEKQVMRAIKLAGGPEGEKRVLAEHLPQLAKVLLSSPMAAYVESVAPREKGADVEAAWIVNVGQDRQIVEKSLAELLALRPDDKPPITEESVAGVAWRRVATPPEAPSVRFGFHEDYFIVALGDPTPEKLVKRLAGAAPKWLDEVRAEHPMTRELTIGYLNVEEILSLAKPFIERDDPKAWPSIEKLGLLHVRSLHGLSGYDEVGCTSVGHIATDGEHTGLLAFLPNKPLDADDLQVVPKDALLALVVNLDPAAVFDEAIKLAGAFDEHVPEHVEKGLWEVETKVGIDLRQDVLGALGDAWAVYLPSGDLMTSWLNAGAAIQVKDAEAVEKCVDKLVDLANAELARQGNHAKIARSEEDGRTIFTVQTAEPIPVTPSWCVGEKWIAFGLNPQTVRSTLEREAEDSLAENPAAAEALSAGPASLAYQDTPQLVRSIYPWIQIGVQMGVGELRKQGIEVDASAMPSLEAIVKHLRPGVSTLRETGDGFLFESHGSVPGNGNAAAAAPIAVALLLPAVQAARDAARSAQDMNNMRMTTLAVFNFLDANGAFPTDVYDEDGKPLLSWRVRLLPYLEQQSLYDQFHLDEPWDSEHNRPLVDAMPPFYASTHGEPTPGKTRLLVFRGEHTAFPGEEAVKIAAITDGTSNTLMFVQANPESAVEWTRPADVQYNEAKPFAGVESPRRQFLAAFCDGSVRRLSLNMGEEAMKGLVTRDGEEVVDYEVIYGN